MTQNEPAALENAEAIIERFGGIRPMATKINVPVTTVQGWKKRNVIPGTRRVQILNAAQQLGVDLSDILNASVSSTSSVVANENVVKTSQPQRPVQLAGSQNFGPAARDVPPLADMALQRQSGDHLPASVQIEIQRAEQRAVSKSAAINVFLVLLAVASVMLLLVPENDKRLDVIEGNVQNLQRKQSFLGNVIPDDIQSKISAISNQITKLQGGVNSAMITARQTSSDLLSPTASIQQKVAGLERNVTRLTGVSPTGNMSVLLARFQALRDSLPGEQLLNRSTAELSSLLSDVSSEDPQALDQTLQAARTQNPDIAQTFKDIPQEDLKAAALLLGMTQFRSSLNRDNQPFADDLALLKKLVGNSDPELQASIDKLAPYAEQGVLTPEGLNTEFRSLAGDVVVASLSGENVSIEDRARARLNNVFQVDKNGEPVSGTPTQNTLTKTDRLLQAGDLEGAIAQMNTLQGPALVAAQPWMTKANATLAAQKFKRFLTQSINLNAGGVLPVSNSGPIYNLSPQTQPQPQVIQDNNSDANVLRPAPPAPSDTLQ